MQFLNNLNSLQQRIISAAIALPFFLFAMWAGGFVFAGMMIIIAMIASQEWLNLVTIKKPQSLDYLMYFTLSLPLAMGFFFGFGIGLIAYLTAFVLTLGLSYLMLGDPEHNPPLHIAAGVLYIGIPFLCIIWLRDSVGLSETAPDWAAVFVLFAMVWITDTGAYFSGKTIGGPKMAPKISPNKTWAGLIGAVVLTLIASISLSLGFETGALWAFVIMGLILPLVAQAGDLFASFLKRRAGVKDTGHILPGHGGILDRLDGVLSAAPFYSIIITLFVK